MIPFPSPLIQGTLVQRYKRFLADVRLETGETVTAHCPNPGAMMGLCNPGLTVWLSRSGAKGRKLPHTLEIVGAATPSGTVLTGINTGRPNAIVAAAIQAGVIAELRGYDTLRREVPCGTNSRIDMLLSGGNRAPCYVEVKNVHLVRRQPLAEFPDCTTARATKHLYELVALVKAGFRAVMVYCVQRGDAEAFTLAADIDPVYDRTFDFALSNGVEALCYKCDVTFNGTEVKAAIPIYNISGNALSLTESVNSIHDTL